MVGKLWVGKLRGASPAGYAARGLFACIAAFAVHGAFAQSPAPTAGTPSEYAPALRLETTLQSAGESGGDPVAGDRTTPSIGPAITISDPLRIGKSLDLTESPDDLWDRIRNGFAMPDLGSPLVLDRQIWYAARPTQIRIMVERSKRYLYHIVDELEKRGLPTELALLPMVESAFNPMAYSRAHASGLWQFIPSTGKTYNLQQNWWTDERRDILASTTAALDYLEFLYDMHGDWHLALASYNWGENAVARAVEKNKSRNLPTDYLSLTMPAETRLYVPKLQALKNIIANPQAFNIELDPIPNHPYFLTVAKNADIDLRTAAKLAEMTVEELIALNSAHNRPVIPVAQSRTLVLPVDRAGTFQANLENHDKPLTSWQTYTLKPGDKLEKIAALSGMTLANLKKINGITPRDKVAAGMQILLPVQGSNAANEPLPGFFQPPPARVVAVQPRSVVQKVTHVVKRGETLPSIAQQYKVSPDDIRRWNQIGRLMAGQKLVLQVTTTRSAQSTSAARKPVARAKGARQPAKVAAKPGARKPQTSQTKR
ncbi:MAG: LysM peptidoglycan-binding domain-containing protein [Betaproteobacteria bacterium]|nr:LysM peptidoglycan-binding domain-containing protein [Betaproteobacteria bacterium]